ncbi:MAG: hypothetical protein LQ345_005777 [Seirophora villosa]|nr:MAG: hypothetical protein LQ345_005777 [Seirophora villosa]
MITDNIAERIQNVPLRSEWELEENYNFVDYHTPECKHKGNDDDKCTCGGGKAEQKGFKTAVNVRKREISERNKKRAAPESKEAREKKTRPGLLEKDEEAGDEEFVVGTPTKSGLKKGSGTPKGRAKTVTWVD